MKRSQKSKKKYRKENGERRKDGRNEVRKKRGKWKGLGNLRKQDELAFFHTNP